MRVPRIFLDQEMSPGQICELDAFASGHVCRVLRMKTGRPLTVFNGRGGEFHALLKEADSRRAQIEIEKFDPVDRESPLQIHLGLALSRGDRFDWAIQKSVELGVTSITPLECARSDRIGDDKRKTKKLDQCKKLIISACEQSGRTAVPQIAELKSCELWLQQAEAGIGFLLHPTGQSISQKIDELPKPLSPAVINLAIGPEGGFDEMEEQFFEQSGFANVAFGPRILRTETAPVAVISLFQSLLGDCS
jgi:16S rRNA (uracil1498-N3)-methyltransferase